MRVKSPGTRQDRPRVILLAAALVAGLGGASPLQALERGEPVLWRKVAVPEELLDTAQVEGQTLRYGGDLRMGDLTGSGRVDFVVYRSAEGGIKPCFLGAFDDEGKTLWHTGRGGAQPVRPGAVLVHDLDGDGRTEVVCFFRDPKKRATPGRFGDMVVQVRDGATGRIERQAAPDALTRWAVATAGTHGNWCHQRLLAANLRGTDTARDFVVKLGFTVLAFDEHLRLLWQHTIPEHKAYEHASYTPAVGDIDGDGRDEVFGGRYLLDHDGQPVWQRVLAHHMDSVAITLWDGDNVRSICSGYGHVLDAQGRVLLELGAEAVPHGQEVRVADFAPELPGREMMIRYRGHRPDVMLVGNDGAIVKRFKLNHSPNETGMEAVYWNGTRGPAVLVNGGVLWHGTGRRLAALPDLPPPAGPKRPARTMAWYHAIPGDVAGDRREEVVVYNPWDRFVWIYTPAPLDRDPYQGYRPGPRQVNPRLMD